LTETSENETSGDDTPLLPSAGAGDGLNVHLEGEGSHDEGGGDDGGEDGGVLQELNLENVTSNRIRLILTSLYVDNKRKEGW
jgi:hypothetical protein